MRWLALETTSFTGSVALLDDGVVVAETVLPSDQRSAKSLAPTVERLLLERAWKPSEINAVAVVRGPGSFTGLRVGITFARTFAYAIGAELLGVDTHDVVAWRTPPSPAPRRLQIVLDAQRDELFAATFHRNVVAGGPAWVRTGETKIVSRRSWIEELTNQDVVSGPGIEKCLRELPAFVTCIDLECGHPTATAAGKRAIWEHGQGRRDELLKLAPQYMRLSYAEEKKAH